MGGREENDQDLDGLDDLDDADPFDKISEGAMESQK